MCQLEVVWKMRFLMSHQRPRILEAPRTLTADKLLRIRPVLCSHVILVRRFQLINKFALLALVVDLLGEMKLLVDQKAFPRSQLLSTEAVDLRQTVVDLSTMP